MLPRLSAGLALILCGLYIFPRDLRAQSLVIHWNSAALQGIRDAKLGAPKVAEQLPSTSSVTEWQCSSALSPDSAQSLPRLSMTGI